MQHEYDEGKTDVEFAKKIDRVKIHLKTRCVEITEDGVWAENEEQSKFFISSDQVILATGLRKDEELKKQFEGLAQDVIFIGDCDKVSDLLNTSSSGYYASLRI